MPLSLHHIIESSLCLSICTIYFWLFLRRSPHCKSNRLFLLSIVLISFIIPFISIHWSLEATTIRDHELGGLSSATLKTVNTFSSGIHKEINHFLSGFNFIKPLYLLGSSFFIFRLGYQIISLGLLTRKFPIKKEGNIHLVTTTGSISAFSFFNWLFINKDQINAPNSHLIIQHEKAHIQQCHSLDIILMEFLLIFQWFNPFSWLLRKAIQENHEYLADHAVLREGVSLSHYQETLLFQTFGIQFGITHGFKKSVTLKRLKMMTQNQSNISAIKGFASLAFFMIVTLSFAGNLSLKQPAPTQSPTPIQTKQKEELVKIPDQMAQFPGGQKNMVTFLSSSIKYPEQAVKEKIQGKVFVAFIVTKEGKIKSPTIRRGVHPILDKEALRIVKNMPDWIPAQKDKKPVPMEFVLPINFQLK